jgi:hypothetical protein
MKKLINLIYFVLFLVFSIPTFSQDLVPNNWSVLNTSGYLVYDVQFINNSTGFAAVVTSGSTGNIMKTTNYGLNWVLLLQNSPISVNITDKKPMGIYFLDENTGFVSSDTKIYKYTSGSAPTLVLTYLNASNQPRRNYINKIIFTNNTTGYSIYTGLDYGDVTWYGRAYKTTNGGNNWYIAKRLPEDGQLDGGHHYLNDIAISGSDNNKIIICGNCRFWNNSNFEQRTLLAYSNDGFNSSSMQRVYEGSYTAVHINTNNDVILLNRELTHNNAQYSYIKLISWGSWSQTPTSLYPFQSPTNYSALDHTAMGFFNDLSGYMLVDNIISNTASKRLYKTTNGGVNWNLDLDAVSTPSGTDGLSTIYNNYFGNFEYALFSWNSSLYMRKIESVSILSNSESGSEANNNIIIDGSSFSSPSYNNWIKPFCNVTFPYYIGDSKVFYKYDDNTLNNTKENYLLQTDKTVEANYKTKQISTVPTALSTLDPSVSVSNSPQIRILKDNNGYVHQVHESMGGVFYTMSTNSGTNWINEEVVNSCKEYQPYSSYINNAADNNSCPALCELRTLKDPAGPFPLADANINVASTWQRYNSGNVEIKIAFREVDNSNNIFWRLYGQSSNYAQNSGVIRNFSASQNYKSKPSIFSAWYNFPYDAGGGITIDPDKNKPFDYLVLVPHLEPATTGNKLVVTARLRGYPAFDCIKNQYLGDNTFIIENSNVTDYAVTSKPFIDGVNRGFILYFTYLMNGNIYYRADKFVTITGSMSPGIGRMSYDEKNDHSSIEISENDHQITRISPDISLRNGRPIVTYRGMSPASKWVQFDNGDGYPLSYTDYPIFVRYKYYSSSAGGEVWSTRAITNSNGVEQKNPNVEGCKNGEAYVLNFKYNNLYKQTAYLQYSPGYCNPGQYPLTDAKLVRGSFYGTSYPYSSPMLLTLNQSGSLYNVSKEIFTISNTRFANVSYLDNLIGTIREQNVNYNFNLGPVIVKNTNLTFENASETSLTNSIEFSNTMVSAPFSLGPNDTLILNGQGYYNYISGNPFLQKNFTVNLMRKSSQGIYMPLFSSAIGVADTIETEYLRGFVFSSDDLPEVDSFYVQLVVDPNSLYQGDVDYGISNAYSPDEVFENGDNSHTLKRVVHFKNGNNHNNVISSIPKTFELSQNYPNPFNPVTNIKYQIPKDGLVTLKVYDITGREIAKLVNEVKPAGFYTVSFNGSNFASGVYFYRIQSGDFVQVKKMLLIK